MGAKITSHRELIVYQRAFDAAIALFAASKQFPREELYSLTDQLRRSSRSVCANLAEAWRKRRYEKAFISKLSDAEAEAAETQVWLEFAHRLQYISTEQHQQLHRTYDEVLRLIVAMINRPEQWTIAESQKQIRELEVEYFTSNVNSKPSKVNSE